jgi:hypothetical protein
MTASISGRTSVGPGRKKVPNEMAGLVEVLGEGYGLATTGYDEGSSTFVAAQHRLLQLGEARKLEISMGDDA